MPSVLAGEIIDTTNTLTKDGQRNIEVKEQLTQNGQKELLNKYLNDTKDERAIQLKNVQNYISTKRNIAREAHNKQNNSFVSNYLNDKKMIFISQFSPVIICELSKQDILDINSLDCVLSISLYSEAELQNCSGLDISTASIGANYAKNTLGLTGNNVKIGMTELGIINTNYAELSDANIITTNGGQITEHASTVASVLVGKNGMVPNATLYNSCAASISTRAAIELLLDSEVSVINCSLGMYTDGSNGSYGGSYETISQWIDYIINHYNVSFVNAAGNTKTAHGEDYSVNILGTGYNSITVGSVDYAFTEATADDYYSSFSRYVMTEGIAKKPDVLAPGADFKFAYEGSIKSSSGTSYSAPHVTGMVAQLIEAFPYLLDKPHVIKAIVLASCDRKVSVGEEMGFITDKAGAGVVNVSRAVMLSNNFEGTISSSGVMERITSTHLVMNNPTTFALTWFKQNTGTSSTASEVALSDLRFYIENDETKHGYWSSSVFDGDSVEYMLFTPTTTGIYNIYIQRNPTTNMVPSDRYALSYIVSATTNPSILNVHPMQSTDYVEVELIRPIQSNCVLSVEAYTDDVLRGSNTLIIEAGLGNVTIMSYCESANKIIVTMWNDTSKTQELCPGKELTKIDADNYWGYTWVEAETTPLNYEITMAPSLVYDNENSVLKLNNICVSVEGELFSLYMCPYIAIKKNTDTIPVAEGFVNIINGFGIFELSIPIQINLQNDFVEISVYKNNTCNELVSNQIIHPLIL